MPWDGVREARLVGGPVVRTARTLGELVEVLRGGRPWPSCSKASEAGRHPGPLGAGAGLAGDGGGGHPASRLESVRRTSPTFAANSSVAGQWRWLLRVGTTFSCPGRQGPGKTMLAERLPGILPPLERSAVIETCRIHSSAGLPLPERTLAGEPPFRAPHHSASAVALVGGGTAYLRPGEISLATNGVLFLDEMAEFPAAVLDALRQPLEEGVIRIARARATVTLPATFLLVGAMNPCPCGQSGAAVACQCSPAALDRYRRRVSGPLLDRFDLHIAVERSPRRICSPPSRGVLGRGGGSGRLCPRDGTGARRPVQRCHRDVPARRAGAARFESDGPAPAPRQPELAQG